ncbi:MAG TPA: aldo/keto reductase [Anaerolineaceae bacterium]|nr:aldo/keto reductase [Anaerolineaceae bacterium]
MSETSHPKELLERISLGINGPQISPLGTGTMQWGDRQIWEYGKGGYTDEDIHQSFLASLEKGINFFDTAEVYGRGLSETFLGRFVNALEDREQVVVATKFMPLPWRVRRSSLVKALRRSLNRLGLKRVDLYQIHWPFPPMPVEHWAAGLADAVEDGLTRTVGVSNFNPSQMNRAYETLSQHGVLLTSNQVCYSLLDRGPEKSGLMHVCKELGITLIAYSPLARGMLTGKYCPENPPGGVRRLMYAGALQRLSGLIAVLSQMGEAHGGKTPAQVSLNWLICKGAVPIPGAKTARQIEENVGALGWRLSADEVAELDEISASF